MTAQDFVGTCAICKRRHQNIGYSPRDRAPIKWMCWECLLPGSGSTDGGATPQPRINLEKFYHMPKRNLDDYERQALEDGGNAAGAYLDDIGKTDLAALTEDEWARFLATVLTGYADSMREIVSREVPY